MIHKTPATWRNARVPLPIYSLAVIFFHSCLSHFLSLLNMTPKWTVVCFGWKWGGSRLFKQARPPIAAHCVFVTSVSTEQHVWESQVREREWEGGGEEERDSHSLLADRQSEEESLGSLLLGQWGLMCRKLSARLISHMVTTQGCWIPRRAVSASNYTADITRRPSGQSLISFRIVKFYRNGDPNILLYWQTLIFLLTFYSSHQILTRPILSRLLTGGHSQVTLRHFS